VLSLGLLTLALLSMLALLGLGLLALLNLLAALCPTVALVAATTLTLRPVHPVWALRTILAGLLVSRSLAGSLRPVAGGRVRRGDNRVGSGGVAR
jgi:hypothetical protein